MAKITHIAVYASEDVVIVRAGMGGIDKDLHGRYGVILFAEQTAVMIAGMGISICDLLLVIGDR